MNKALYICRIVKTHKLVRFSGPHSYLGPSCSREFPPKIYVLKVRLNYIYILLRIIVSSYAHISLMLA